MHSEEYKAQNHCTCNINNENIAEKRIHLQHLELNVTRFEGVDWTIYHSDAGHLQPIICIESLIRRKY